MTEEKAEKLLKLLSEIRDNQRLQIEQQTASISIQKAQMDEVKKQFDRADKMNDKAEEIQNKQAQLISGARKVQKIAIPFLMVIFIFLAWFSIFKI